MTLKQTPTMHAIRADQVRADYRYELQEQAPAGNWVTSMQANDHGTIWRQGEYYIREYGKAHRLVDHTEAWANDAIAMHAHEIVESALNLMRQTKDYTLFQHYVSETFESWVEYEWDERVPLAGAVIAALRKMGVWNPLCTWTAEHNLVYSA